MPGKNLTKRIIEQPKKHTTRAAVVLFITLAECYLIKFIFQPFLADLHEPQKKLESQVDQRQESKRTNPRRYVERSSAFKNLLMAVS